MTEVVNGLKECSEFDGVVVIPRFSEPRDFSKVPQSEAWASFLARASRLPTPQFVRVPFHEPFLICYSSGTTGNPKAIVHSVGGALISYFKEGRLHEGIGRDSVTLQYTTVGWIMYLANVGALLVGARSVMYDGSPFQPDAKTLVRVVEEQKVTKLGISPRWMFELAKNGISPREIADLSSLKIVTCTGMVLSDQLFEWFYDKGFPRSVHLANISGGTDIVSTYLPTRPDLVGMILSINSANHSMRPLLGRLLRSHEPSHPCLRWWNPRTVSRSPDRHLRCSPARRTGKTSRGRNPR